MRKRYNHLITITKNMLLTLDNDHQITLLPYLNYADDCPGRKPMHMQFR